MDPQDATPNRVQVEELHSQHPTSLVTLVFTDVVVSGV
jgi:hypothetical protein